MRQERQKHSKGYWLTYKPDHPYANKDGYIPEQRLLMEELIGRYVNPLVEDVHHEDEDVQNNILANLILLTKTEHRRLHAGWKLIDGEWWKMCTGCDRLLKVEGNFYKRHSSHNEYMSKCIDCIKKQVALSRPLPLTHEEISAMARRRAYKAWETRNRINRG